jgi:hypothetical protein
VTDGLSGGGVAFVVAGQASVAGEPGEGPLDRPPSRDHGESLLALGLRTTSIVVFTVVWAQSTRLPANPPSANRCRTRRRMLDNDTCWRCRSSSTRAAHREVKVAEEVAVDAQLQLPDPAAGHDGPNTHDREAVSRRIGLRALHRRVDQAPPGQRVSQGVTDIAGELVHAVQVVKRAPGPGDREVMIAQTPRRMRPTRRRPHRHHATISTRFDHKFDDVTSPEV